ncbi:Protein SRG1 [Morella rubra]|uniref:Protein SRG1 n=1 Tax=Morella rubra TaxID=262757 RepID=A0A6A1WHX6_9ROSI|nr:Protein SRG1 [Morella rubra]
MALVPENLKWSLPVPSVQELAIQGLDKVPPRYVREDVDKIVVASTSDPALRVPLIDMNKLVYPDSQEKEVQKLHSACKEWGVFQMIHHGVSDESLTNMREQVQGFFDLPFQEKKSWAQKPGNIEGYGQAFVTSEDQKLEWNDMIFLRALPVESRDLTFWPEKPRDFRKALNAYSEDMRRVAVSLMRFIAMGLGLEGQQYSDNYKEGMCDVRVNCYPPCPEPERVMGANPHGDICGITLLLECGDMPGLQVLKDGHWVVVEPIYGAMVVNLGYISCRSKYLNYQIPNEIYLIMQIMSNGIYKAPDHRAMVNKFKQRLSIVTFCYPNSSVDIGPAVELINSEHPPLYKTLTEAEYFHSYFPTFVSH